MARSRPTKTPKIAWFCRSCGKAQNRKAAPRPRPICQGCGRVMETEHYIADVPVDDFGVALVPAPPAESAPNESPARPPAHDANIALRLLDHENRLARLEKSPTTIIAELERALLVMDADQLAGLDAMLARAADRLDDVRRKVRRLRSPEDGN